MVVIGVTNIGPYQLLVINVKSEDISSKVCSTFLKTFLLVRSVSKEPQGGRGFNIRSHEDVRQSWGRVVLAQNSGNEMYFSNRYSLFRV